MSTHNAHMHPTLQLPSWGLASLLTLPFSLPTHLIRNTYTIMRRHSVSISPKGLRRISQRCLDYMEEWVWAPHTDQRGYFSELLNKPLKDELTGNSVHVLGVSNHSPDSVDFVRSKVKEFAGLPGETVVCCDFYDLGALGDIQGAHYEGDLKQRGKLVEKVAGVGFPPDLLAESIANFQKRGLEPFLSFAAVKAECEREGLLCKSLGLSPKHAFLRLRFIHKLAASLVAQADPSSEAFLPSEMGLHSNPSAHLFSNHLASLYKEFPTPSLVRNRLTSIDTPTLFFRHIHPTVHLVTKVKELLWNVEFNNGRIVVVLDAVNAPLFYKIFKDDGLEEEDYCGISAPLAVEEESNFNATDEDAVVKHLEHEEKIQESRSPAESQAKFELDVLLFIHLTKIRPDILHFRQALANVFIVNGFVGNALVYLRSMVDQRIDGAENILTSLINNMIDEGYADVADPMIQSFLAPPRPIEETAADEFFKRQIRNPLPETDLSDEIDYGAGMVTHNAEGVVRSVVPSEIPEMESIKAGELSERRKEVIETALVGYEEKKIMEATPAEAVQKVMQKAAKKVQGLEFAVSAFHPYTEAHYAIEGADLPSDGVVHALQRYRPNSDFPVAPEQKHALSEHAAASQHHVAKQTTGDQSAAEYHVSESHRIRTTSPPRTPLDFDRMKTAKLERGAATNSRMRDRHQKIKQRYHQRQTAAGL